MRPLIIIATKLIISAIIIWFLTHTAKLNCNLLLDLLNSPLLLTLTILLYFVIVGISTWRWHQLNSGQNINLPYMQTLLPTYLGIAFNNILPGGVGGDFFRFYLINKNITVKKSGLMLSILFDRVTGLMGIFLAAGLVAVFSLSNLNSQQFMLFFATSCLLICISITAFLLAYKLLSKQVGIYSWINGKFTHKRWLTHASSLINAIRIYSNSKNIISGCLAASVLIQILIAITCMLIAKMMGFPYIPFSHYMIALAVTQIVNLIPIAPGGFGVGEMAFANVLSILSPSSGPTSYATIFLAYRIIGIITYIPGLSILIFNSQLIKEINMHKEKIQSSI